MTVAIGIFSAVCERCSFWKLGDSDTRRRMMKPTTTSKPESRNGTRQPHAANCSGVVIAVVMAITPVERISAGEMPICGHAP
nr:hypothetical protein [Caballeronia telluris]